MHTLTADTVQEALQLAARYRDLAENEQELLDAGYDPVWHGAEKERCLHQAREYEEQARKMARGEKLRQEWIESREVPPSEQREEGGNEPVDTDHRHL